MNTWLHHPGYEYTEAITNWNKSWHPGGRFHIEKPNFGAMMASSAGLVKPEIAFPALPDGHIEGLEGEAKIVYDGYRAPIKDMPDEAFNGFRRFPLSIPLDSYDNGNGAAQTLHYRLLLEWDKQVNFIWGCADNVFNEAWGRTWAERMNASFDGISDAGHFLQNTHGPEVVKLILERS